MQDRQIREYMTTVRCSVCGQNYQLDNINIIGHQEELWFISVFCGSCQTKGLVAAVVKDEDDAKESTTPKEAEREFAKPSDPVDMDDVLDMHNFLRDFKGGFSELFGRDGTG